MEKAATDIYTFARLREDGFTCVDMTEALYAPVFERECGILRAVIGKQPQKPAEDESRAPYCRISAYLV